MENSNLERRVSRAKDDIDSIVSELISEIEEKEKQISDLTDKVDALEEEINNLKNN